MDFITEPNGNITFKVGDSREDLFALKSRVGADDVSFLAEMIDMAGWLGNGVFTPIRPDDVGALTDAPMFSDAVEYSDLGAINVVGKVWWFPNYQVEDFANTLLEEGQVTFILAPDD